MKKYLKTYLYNRPLFYVFLRPKELKLFHLEFPFKKPVLDFGCGDGFFAKALIGRKRIDVGVDIDKKALSCAEGSGIYKQVVLFNGHKLPFNRDYFSVVVSNCVMEHVIKLQPTLKEIQRVMKSGGKFYLSVMTDKWNDYLIGGRLMGGQYLKWMKKIQRHPNLLSEFQWEKEFEKAGFKVLEKYGYLDRKTSRLIEIFHYLSIGSLITYKLFGKWVVFPGRFKLIEKYVGTKLKKVKTSDAAAIFFTLKKI